MIGLAVRRPVAVAMAYLALALLGVLAWRNIPVELLPDTRHPRLTIQATWAGASPETTEAFLTSPMEAAVQQVAGVERITSTSDEFRGSGRARIAVEFQRGVDMNFARLELSERLQVLDEELPAAATRPRISEYVPPEFREQTGAFMRYTVTGPYTLEALREHVDAVVEPSLLQVDGVAAVRAYGGRRRLLEVELDEGRLLAAGLRPQDVWNRLSDLDIVVEAGQVRERGRVHAVAIREHAASADDVGALVLRSEGGVPLRLSDVGRVRDGFEDAASHDRIDGFPALSFEVMREIGSNAMRVADGVHARLAALESAHPTGVRLLLDRDESEQIRAQLTDLRTRAIAAAVVIFLVLLLFLRSLRSAAVVFLTIGFALLIAINLIYFGGLSLNVLTLMGLAMGFGLIVDNAIVVLENVYRRRRQGEGAAAAAERGAREVVLPILAATATTVVVLIPFVYLQGELQIYYVPLAVAVGLSLLASLFVAFTFIPALSGLLLRARMRAEPPAQAAAGPDRRQWFVRLYAGMTGLTLRFPWAAVVLAAMAFGGAWYLFDNHVNRGVLWSSWRSDRSYIDVIIRLPRGEELSRTDELARHFEERLREMPEVSRFVTQVQPQFAHIRVEFPDSLEHTDVPLLTHEQMVAYGVRFGGANITITGRGQAFYGGGSMPPNYAVEVRGYNYERVREIAEELGRRLSRFSRVQEVDTNASAGRFTRDRATELVLVPDRARLAMHELTVRDLVSQVSAVVSAPDRQRMGRIGGEEYLLGVRFAGHQRMDDIALQELLIPARGGQSLRLGDVAELRERQVLTEVRRENQQYQRTVAYEFRGPVRLGDAVRDAVLDATAVPPGYQIEARSIGRWSAEEQRQIVWVLALALLLVFMTTAALFESLRQPLVVLLTVPMALTGVFLIFFYTNASFTREAYIGVIMMGGVVVNNAILLVDHVNRLRRVELLPLAEALLRGTLDRARPILMTSATTIFGLLPLVLFSSHADQNIWNALAYALIGGLAASTLFVLTVTPALYLLFERGPERRGIGRTPGHTAPAG
jgi:hydrophobic/amphiphilic exporter-1 (mainly G- bacteria), HAE1 family